LKPLAAEEPYRPGTGTTVAAALVTGAARRIGRAIALSLARQGWKVAVHYHGSAEAAEATAEEIRASGGTAVAINADLSRENEVVGLLPSAEHALGPITLLVNNASVFEPDDIQSIDAALWERHFAVNLRGPVLLARDFARQLPAASRGAIVNVIDQRVLRPTPHFLSYTLSKSALLTATQTLAQALAPRITVNAVGPGPTLASRRQDPSEFARQGASLPLGHGPHPEEIADAVLFLADATSVTGQMLAVDGGQHLAWQTPDVLVSE
jgi:NAD(P)-dependent dehydrogenase (short-subunit alcohol dehydrogenase family)